MDFHFCESAYILQSLLQHADVLVKSKKINTLSIILDSVFLLIGSISYAALSLCIEG
jgi:hypothetical protein